MSPNASVSEASAFYGHPSKLTTFALTSLIKGKDKLKLSTSAGRHIINYTHGPWVAEVAGTTSGKKDLRVEWKKNIKSGSKPIDLTIIQRVPAQQFFLVPSPEVKMTTTTIRTKRFKDELILSYDTQTHIGRVDEMLELDSKYKLRVQADSLTAEQGALVTLTAKVDKPWAKTLATAFSKARGPMAMYEVQYPFASSKPRAYLYTTAYTRTKEVTALAELRPKKEGRVKLTAEGRFRSGAFSQPSLLFGLKYIK